MATTETTTESKQSKSGPAGKLGKNKNVILVAAGGALLFLMTKGHNAAAGSADDGSGSTTVAGTVVPVAGPAAAAGEYSTGDVYNPGGYVGGDINAPFSPGGSAPGGGVGYSPPSDAGSVKKLQHQVNNQKKRLDNLKKHRKQDEGRIHRLTQQQRSRSRRSTPGKPRTRATQNQAGESEAA